jgi:cellulose synthase/poly-beta-1,6-N-acetylglucosamine synthase-like glycosyltransferase
VSAISAAAVALLLAWFVAGKLGYLALNFLALGTLRRKVTLRPLENLPPVHQSLVPPVTVIVPLRDAAAVAVERVRAALAIDYAGVEVVVVNDGSRDDTLERLREAFALEAFPEVYWRRIAVKPVRTIYHSHLHKGLRVVDKERGGTADAINAGVNTSRYPLVIALDPAWSLRNDALRVLVEPFVDDPATLASCSTLRIDHGESGALDAAVVELPASQLARVQVVEYLREPLFTRLGWARMNAALAVSDSAILFRKDAIVEAGGFRADVLAPEMEIVTRLHRLWREKGERYAVAVVPDPVCWTPAAASIRELREQRMRWQVSLAQSLTANAALLFTRRGGAPRWVAFPFLLAFELYGPAIEVFAWLLLSAMFVMDLMPGMALVAIAALVFAMGFLVSVSSLLLEELSFRLYPRWGQAARLTLAAVVENLGFRQLVACWRLDALIGWWQSR